MNYTFVFIHKQSRFPVAYAAEHCANLGFRTVVLGEPDWRFDKCLMEPLSDYEDGVAKLNEAYIHASPNTPSFELFCFARWIILRNYMRKQSITDVIYVDSDALVYPGIHKIISHSEGKMVDTPFLNFFRDYTQLDLLVETIFQTFKSHNSHEAVAVMDRDNRRYYTDMLLFPRFSMVNSSLMHRWSSTMEKHGFDSNINRPNEYASFSCHPSGIKRVISTPEGVCIVNKDGIRIPFYFLHFQGHSKPLMKYYLSQPLTECSLQWWPESRHPQVLEAMRALETPPTSL
jgi:hypothetical protein